MQRKKKTIGFWNYHEFLNKNNFMLEHENTSIGDDLLLPLVELAKYLRARNITAATLDVLDPGQVDAYLFLDLPAKGNSHFRTALHSGKPLYLLILESPLVRPENNDVVNHACFKKIFTYNDNQVDEKKYIKLNYAFSFPQELYFDIQKKEKLCVSIAGNKKIKKQIDPRELYSERVKAIRWFENNHPGEFDLYGFGWAKPPLKISYLFNPFKLRKVLSAPLYTTYRGAVERKRPVLEKYKFAICYENIRDIPGYITEKIFDCFFAGCVPVYLGANNITDHVPGNCFIDKRKFSDYESLYNFLVSMPESEYKQYLSNIEMFLKSTAARKFSCENFVKIVADEILSSL